ncbi:hypothetical protein BDV95DRAFT_50164 [Massariosphaeria phaeospora]|uniref:Uncharacterized protein n=1 Tax=Massariosphaeria phaeospora TaxID=100035 RepID=A0A7C8MN78_9PLEO|nr:hypothetical protein BDV95DRAFT_50164 [Massariosphaeria phaeospora]
MSGNPFRLSLHQNHAGAGPTPSTSFVDGDSSRAEDPELLESDSVPRAAPQPAKTKKSVRIESPAASPPHPEFRDADDSLLQHISDRRGRHAASPPPASPAGFSDNFEDVAAERALKRDTEDGVDAQGTPGNPRISPGTTETLQSLNAAPVNPFSRTLASIEPQQLQGSTNTDSAQAAGQTKDWPATARSRSTNARASLDVEGFKNLLMKGISGPRNSGPSPQSTTVPHPNTAPLFESSSSTDTSSVSRQSVFETVQEAPGESWRISNDMAVSDDEERVGLVTQTRKGKKKPPPTPRHRHGKLVTSRTPQTVSFSNFSVTEPTATPEPRSRTNSDLNKPLPPPPPVLTPPVHIVSQNSTQNQPPLLETRASESSIHSDTPPMQKKIPPPVPIARRHSQLRTSTRENRSRSNSTLTMSSQHSADFPPMSPIVAKESSSSSPSVQKAPPPPPPARRHGQSLSERNPPSAESPTTDPATTTTPRRPAVPSPHPPASRRTTLSSPPSPAPGLTRTPSVNSPINNARSVSNEHTAGMAPPPPPPRRRQSGRSSIDKERPYPPPSASPTDSRRTSSELKRNSFDNNKRRTSVASESSLRREYAPVAEEAELPLYSPQEELVEEPMDLAGAGEVAVEPGAAAAVADSSKILDDMERFQREIDELRARYK